MENLTIISPVTFEQSHYNAINQLLGQLSSRCISFTEEDYRRLIEEPFSKFFLLLDGELVVGMLTIGCYFTPTGSKAWIEDVVVDNAYRGRGCGRMLVTHAIEYCKSQNINTLMLTSKPKRIAANALYQSVGFEHKETNVYKMEL